MKTELETGDVIFKLRHGSAEEMLVIDKTSLQLAFSGEYRFVKNSIEIITRVTEETGYVKLFGESFVLQTPENLEKHIREIKLRFIRNFPYHLLDNYNLRRIEKHLKTLNI
jgi:hypothetical protein